jgi:hypothetical protein
VRVEEGEEVGECPNCGIVSGDDVNFNFPNQATCGDCGAELERAGIANETRTINQ